MNLKNRLKKIETGLNLDSEFCRCEREIVFKVEPRSDAETGDTLKICDDCGKKYNHFVVTFNIGEIRVIEPRADFTREEFEIHQNKHVMSRHRSYEEFLEEQNR